jgi:outer membrane usher protein
VRRGTRRCAACLLLALACASVAAQAPAPETLYLEVRVNSLATGLIVRFNNSAAGLSASAASLRELGIALDPLTMPGEQEILLDAIAGLRYEYDAAGQRISLQVADALRAPFRLDARAPAPADGVGSGSGVVLNYDALVQRGAARAILAANELRYFNDAGVFSSSGLASVDRGASRYLRYNTSWSTADPLTLRAFQAGDLISSALPWSRSVRLGGLQWRRNFALQPELTTFPVASLRGSALVPSALNLYVNGVQQLSSAVPAGPFEVNQVAGISGAGEARIVTRDALGREQLKVVALYVDTRLLAPGLFDYSAEAGVLRRDFGSRSFGYASQPVASASGRYGLSPLITLEAHGEAAAGLLNGGAGILANLDGRGVLSATVAASAGRARGGLAALGYQYLGRGTGIDVYSMRASPRYTDLAARDGSVVTRSIDRVALSAALFGGQSVGLSYIGYQSSAAAAHLVSLSWGATLGQRIFISASAFQDLRQRASRGVYLNLSFAFGNRTSASAGGGRQNGIARRALQLMRSPALDGGIGWDLQRSQNGAGALSQGQLQYLGSYGRIGALAQYSEGNRAASIDASGALVLMDGTLAATRQVGSGFALVSTGGVAGVPVIHENRRIGVTDSGGHLLVPNLNAYGSNRVAIDIADLAADARVATTSMNVVPRQLSGVLARFPVERYRAASVLLRGADGTPLAAGTPVRHRQSGLETIVGHDGIAFVDNLGEDNTLDVGQGETACTVTFRYLRADAPALPTIGPLRCVAAAQGAR